MKTIIPCYITVPAIRLMVAIVAMLAVPTIAVRADSGDSGDSADNNGRRQDTAQHPSLSITDAIQSALRNDIDLRDIEVEVDSSRTRLDLDVRQFLPAVTLSLGQRDSVTDNAPDSRQRNIGLTVVQPIYPGLEPFQRRREALNTIDYLRNRRIERHRAVVAATIEGWIDVLLANMRRGIVDETIAVAQKELEISERGRQIGIITEIDWIEGQLAVRDLELRRDDIHNEARLATYRLSRIIDVPDGIVPAGMIDLAYRGMLVDREQQGYRVGLERTNAELQRARTQIIELRRTLDQEFLFVIPSVAAELNVNLSGPVWPLDQIGFSAGLNLVFPIPSSPLSFNIRFGHNVPDERSLQFEITSAPLQDLQPFVERSEVERRLKRQALGYRMQRDDLNTAIGERLIEIERHHNALDALRERRQLEQRRLDTLRVQAELGITRGIDLLQAEIEIGQLRISLAEAIGDLFSRELELLRLSGSPSLADSHRAIILSPSEDAQ